MSTSLHCKPVPPQPAHTAIGDTSLKYVLAAKLWPDEGDGSLCHTRVFGTP
jgi:hypothetical protein